MAGKRHSCSLLILAMTRFARLMFQVMSVKALGLPLGINQEETNNPIVLAQSVRFVQPIDEAVKCHKEIVSAILCSVLY